MYTNISKCVPFVNQANVVNCSPFWCKLLQTNWTISSNHRFTIPIISNPWATMCMSIGLRGLLRATHISDRPIIEATEANKVWVNPSYEWVMYIGSTRGVNLLGQTDTAANCSELDRWPLVSRTRSIVFTLRW